MGNSKLSHAIRETREWMEINGNPDAGDDDAIGNLMDECGRDDDGSCSLAGSEYCDWECPFQGDQDYEQNFDHIDDDVPL